LQQAQQLVTPQPGSSFSLASWAQTAEPSAISRLLAPLTRPDLLSFGHVLPAAELFPAEAYGRATLGLLATDPGSLQYCSPSRTLKAMVVELMRLRGVQCSDDQIFLTAGAQHALSLSARLLLDPGSSFVLDRTVYDGIVVVTRPFQPTLLTVPCRAGDGMDVDAVESLLNGGARPRFIYVIPDGHNPTSSSLPMSQRQRLVELARVHGVPILEDDPYGLLGFGRGFEPPLHALAPDHVLYVGSFSKLLAPSLRLGWIVAPPALVPRLSSVRQGCDLDVASLTQQAVARLLDGMDLSAHLELLRREYSRRMEAMLDALAEHFPRDAVWHRPSGGMFIWVVLPRRVDTVALLADAVERERVGFVPGEAFAVGDASPAASALRLTFSALPPDRIAEGIRRLGRVVRRACG
jgi:2-aminoadipate transaminase